MTNISSLKLILEEASAKKRFGMVALHREIVQTLTGTPISKSYLRFLNALGDKAGNYVFTSLIRASFLIEIVKTPKIESTKMEVRWADRLGTNDPRYASYEDCYQIFEEGIICIEQAIDEAENREILTILAKKRVLAYELPLDYNRRENTGHIHQPNNIIWLWNNEGFNRAIKLRAFLVNKATNPYAQVFANAYSDKIKVKTYLTDRVLTGEHKTNREKRWEVHPNSVHFAFRRTCIEIENQLIYQLCSFEDFPQYLKEQLEVGGLLIPIEAPFRCPITLDPLRFNSFVEEIKQPVHGKSEFQVGHLNPLKAINNDPHSGHTSLNISWISSNGNRIQGSLTLEQTRKLIGRIAKNYEWLGIPLEPGAEEETIAEVEEEVGEVEETTDEGEMEI